ncbi:MAG: diphthine--ammonia ligase [Vicinamibacterales bacterium]
MTRSIAAISWSGGKDCCTALMRVSASLDVRLMLTMFGEDGQRSRSHGLRPDIIAAQAERLGVESLTTRCTWDTYTAQYIAMLGEARARGVTHVVFGDIMGAEHRAWNEQVCAAHGLTAVMPIWGEPTRRLATEFITQGGEAVLVTVRPPALDESWLGTILAADTLDRFEHSGIDPCGEFGEYHTVVTHCPLFSSRLELVPGRRVLSNGCWAMDFTLS